MSKPRFEKGKPIKSLDDLYNQELVYVGDKILHSGFYKNWTLKLCQQLIDDESVFYALEKINKRGR